MKPDRMHINELRPFTRWLAPAVKRAKELRRNRSQRDRGVAFLLDEWRRNDPDVPEIDGDALFVIHELVKELVELDGHIRDAARAMGVPVPEEGKQS